MNACAELRCVTKTRENLAGAFFVAFAAFHQLAHDLQSRGALGEKFVRFGSRDARGVEVAAQMLELAFGALEFFFAILQRARMLV